VEQQEETVIERVVGAPPRAAGVLVTAAYALVVVGVWIALQLWGLGTVPFHTKGEPREGLVVWEMTHGGGWMLPRRNGVELPSKPPLFHWLAAATSLAHGATDEWSIRFPSAALSLLALLCVFAAGSRLWNARAGLISALALITMFEWARAATNARVDMTLTFGLQLAFLSLLFFLRSRARGWLVPLYLGIAWAVLGKGPVGVALPGLAALIMVALTRDLSILRQMRLGRGALCVGLIAGSWYVVALILGGWEFFRKQVLAENLFTFLDNPDFGGGHRHPAAYLLGALLLGILPWALFLPGVAARLWRQRRELTQHDPRVYLLVWIVVVFSFYALAASKRGVYLLGLYPAVALLLGWWWDEQSRATPDEERWLARLLPLVGWPFLVAVALVFLAALLESLGAPVCATAQRWLPPDAQGFAPWIGETVRTSRWPLLGALLLAGASLYACIRAARVARWMGIFAGLFVTVAVAVVLVSQIILPGIARHQSLRTFMADVRQVTGSTGELFFYKTFDYGAVFYSQAHIATYEGSWPAGAPRYLLMQQAQWEQARATAGAQYERVAVPSEEQPAAPERLVLIRRVGD
jgi:4-amino-4-deoxy-L-arabinose transferase-like glycosyltransferase